VSALIVRQANLEDLEEIFLMGSDAWNEGSSIESYLDGCWNSAKYRAGKWYVLSLNDKLVSSLIVYESCFDLAEGFHGIGSVATDIDSRRCGYASNLVSAVSSELKDAGSAGIFLFSDVNPDFYKALGFEIIRGQRSEGNTHCMLLAFQESKGLNHVGPSYF
jgi:predicted acetyltransferase